MVDKAPGIGALIPPGREARFRDGFAPDCLLQRRVYCEPGRPGPGGMASAAATLAVAGRSAAFRAWPKPWHNKTVGPLPQTGMVGGGHPPFDNVKMRQAVLAVADQRDYMSAMARTADSRIGTARDNYLAHGCLTGAVGARSGVYR
jgi:hypothetical protein